MEEEAYADEFGDYDELYDEILAESAASDIPSSREADAEAAPGIAGVGQTYAVAAPGEVKDAKQAERKGPQRGIPAAYFEELSTIGAAEGRPQSSSWGGPVNGVGNGAVRGGRGGRGGPGAAGGRGGGQSVGQRGLPPDNRPMMLAGLMPGGLRPPPGMLLPNGMPVALQMQMQGRPMGPMGPLVPMPPMRPAVTAPPLMMHSGTSGSVGRGPLGGRGRGRAFSNPDAMPPGQGAGAAPPGTGRLGAGGKPLMPPLPPPPGALRVPVSGGRGGSRGPPIGVPTGRPGGMPRPVAGPLQPMLAAAGGAVHSGIPAMEMLQQQMLRAVAAGATGGPLLANMAAAGMANPGMAYMLRALQQRQHTADSGPQWTVRSGLAATAAAEASVMGTTNFGDAKAARPGEDEAIPGPAALDLAMPSIFPTELPRTSGCIGSDGEGVGTADGCTNDAGVASSGQDNGMPSIAAQALPPQPSFPQQMKQQEQLPAHLRMPGPAGGPHLQEQQRQNYSHVLQQQQPINQHRTDDERGDIGGLDCETQEAHLQQQIRQPPNKRQMILNPPALRANGPQKSLQTAQQLSSGQEQQQQPSGAVSAFADGGYANLAGCADAQPQPTEEIWGHGYSQLSMPTQQQPKGEQDSSIYPTSKPNGSNSLERVEFGPGSGWRGQEDDAWDWQQWGGEVELVGGRISSGDVDAAGVDAATEGFGQHAVRLLEDAARENPPNPGQAAAAGVDSLRRRASQGHWAGATRPGALDVTGLWAGAASTAATSPSGAPPRPGARSGAASHKWVREGVATGPAAAPATSGVTATTTQVSASAPSTYTTQNGVPVAAPAATTSCTALPANGAPSGPPGGAAASAVNSEVLKKTEDAIALMKRVIALEEARLKQQQQQRKRKAAAAAAGGPLGKALKVAGGSSASAAAIAPSSTGTGPTRPSTPSAKRQKGNSTGNEQPTKVPAGRAAGTEPDRAGTAAKQAARSVPSRNGAARPREDVQEPYVFEDDGTGLYDEAYDQHHHHNREEGAAGAGLDAIVAGQGGTSNRTGGLGLGPTTGSVEGGKSSALEDGGGGSCGGESSGQLQLQDQQLDEILQTDGGAYDDEDLLLSDDLPAELDGDYLDREIIAGLRAAGNGAEAGGSTAGGSAARGPAVAKRVRDGSIEGDLRPSTAQRQRTS